MAFNPVVNRCTTFKNVRILKFEEESIELILKTPEEGRKVFVNTKSFNLYYNTNTNTLKVMNTLQEIKLKSQKDPDPKIKRIKLNSSLEELVDRSNIEKLLEGYIKAVSTNV